MNAPAEKPAIAAGFVLDIRIGQAVVVTDGSLQGRSGKLIAIRLDDEGAIDADVVLDEPLVHKAWTSSDGHHFPETRSYRVGVKAHELAPFDDAREQGVKLKAAYAEACARIKELEEIQRELCYELRQAQGLLEHAVHLTRSEEMRALMEKHASAAKALTERLGFE